VFQHQIQVLADSGTGPNSAGGTESKSARDSTDASGCSGTGECACWW
jgi:hypothetical protein